MGKQSIFVFYSIILILFSGCFEEIKNPSLLKVSEIKPSYVNNDHAAESLLLTLKNGLILHFFRLDPGLGGGHVGNGGRIVCRESVDNGATWTEPITIFDDEWDNRNIRGGLTEDGTIVLFFRRYDGNNWKPVDLNYIVSKDNGKSWTKRTQLVEFQRFVDNFYEIWISNFTNIGNGRYLIPVCGPKYCEMKIFRVQEEKVVFESKNFIFDYIKNGEAEIDEPYIAIMPEKNKLVCLFRDEANSNYYQSISLNNGVGWTQPVKTNMLEQYFCPSPLIFYEDMSEKIITIATDRRNISTKNDKDALQSQVSIFTNTIDEVVAGSKNYKLLFQMGRPKPNEYQFYGYPAYTKTIDGKYVVIFTESFVDSVNEEADLYQFVLSY